MTNVDISHTDYAKQLIQSLEQDRTFNIELKEASNVFLEKSVETYYDFYEKWELGNDQFDPALFPDKFVEEDS